ncbi:MAG: hypothetical protein ABIO39_04325 [Caulobacteraceae bacterium]
MVATAAGARARRSRPARVVTVCVAGRPAFQPRFNENRIELISAVVRRIRDHPDWDPIDALLFPAGFFRLSGWYGPLSNSQRLELLDEATELDVCRVSARKLSRRSPGCLVVVGVDTGRSPQRWRGDQLVAAYDSSGPLKLARKIFPVDGDTNGNTKPPYLLFETDAEANARTLRLANGDHAILSACYDGFVFGELAIGPTSKRRAMRYIGQAHPLYRWLEPEDVDQMLASLAKGVRRLQPAVSLVAIHGFERPGGDVYWQRHGLATSSAALDGALAVGAAHFRERLPHLIEKSPLAASGVPERHLWTNHHRRAHALTPVDGFEVGLPWAKSVRALVRLFKAT